jgi:hypothetical protein
MIIVFSLDFQVGFLLVDSMLLKMQDLHRVLQIDNQQCLNWLMSCLDLVLLSKLMKMMQDRRMLDAFALYFRIQ